MIDRYAQMRVVKLYTPAWIPYLAEICSGLDEVSPGDRIVIRFSRSVLKQPEFLAGLSDGQSLSGPPTSEPVLFQENGLVFEADPVLGQKTGFFLDQRDNRARVERLASGGSVLNVFAYTGGFSVYAARGEAREVVSVDLSAPALQGAVRNFSHNRTIPAVAAAVHETVAQDAFAVLERLAADPRRFDLVILDPPMFAQNQAQITAALSAYQRLTRLGLGVLRPGGVLVQASCSSRVEPAVFFNAIHQAAQDSKRRLTEIERTGHALDHPIGFAEGAYLKCLFARAE